jgi:hypothetical protein
MVKYGIIHKFQMGLILPKISLALIEMAHINSGEKISRQVSMLDHIVIVQPTHGKKIPMKL